MRIWDEVREAIDEWMGGDPEQRDDDPALLFHLLLAAPLLMGLVAMLRRP